MLAFIVHIVNVACCRLVREFNKLSSIVRHITHIESVPATNQY